MTKETPPTIHRVHSLRFKSEQERETFEVFLEKQWSDYLFNNRNAKMSIISDGAKSLVVIWVFRDRNTALEVIKIGEKTVVPYIKKMFHSEHLTINGVLISEKGALV